MHEQVNTIIRLYTALFGRSYLSHQMSFIDSVLQTLNSSDKNQIIDALNAHGIPILYAVYIIFNNEVFNRAYRSRKLSSITLEYGIKIEETTLEDNTIGYILTSDSTLGTKKDITNAKSLLRTHLEEFYKKYNISNHLLTRDFIDDTFGTINPTIKSKPAQNADFLNVSINKITNHLTHAIKVNAETFAEMNTDSIITTFIETLRIEIERSVVSNVRQEIDKMLNFQNVRQEIDKMLNFQEVYHSLIKSGIDINIPENGETVLHFALRNNDNTTAKLLLENGANLFIPNIYQQTSIDLYKSEYHQPLLPVIILSGLSQITDKNQHIFLEFLIQNKQDILEINPAEFLQIFNEAKLANNLYLLYKFAPNWVKQTATHAARQLEQFHNQTNDNGETTLFMASRDGNTQEVLRLLSKGANPQIINKKGYSPLFYAACGGHKKNYGITSRLWRR
jgi:ankyrin repeat protein